MAFNFIIQSIIGFAMVRWKESVTGYTELIFVLYGLIWQYCVLKYLRTEVRGELDDQRGWLE
jgi:hypothetical protein